jgi:hypothetical protein
MWDLKQIEAADTADIALKDALGNDLPGASVTLYGPGSMEYRRAALRWRRRNKKLDENDEAGFLKSNAEFLADVTQAMNGIEYEGLSGREMAVAIYANPKLGFIATRVLNAMGDWGKFTPVTLIA